MWCFLYCFATLEENTYHETINIIGKLLMKNAACVLGIVYLVIECLYNSFTIFFYFLRVHTNTHTHTPSVNPYI